MCGILGFCGAAASHSIKEAIRDLSHRGPDETRTFTDGDFSFGVTRLSINDLVGGSMPIFNEDGTILVVQNGEIYNSPNLRRELQRLGHTFETRSDTEVLVHAYEEYGNKMVYKIEGIFAFAIYDMKRRELFLGRDRMGVKPLYYAGNGGLIFASEAKTIIRVRGSPVEINRQHIAERFVFGHPVSFSSIFDGIHQVPPGHTLCYNLGGSLTISAYYEPAFMEAEISLEDAVEATCKALKNSVARQLLSDVPVGVLLSGGVDSGVIARLASDANPAALQTFAVGDDPCRPDIIHARSLASLLRSEHHEIIVDPQDSVQHLPRYIWALEDFDYNHMLLYFLGAALKGKVKVALSGHGADEIFFGYGMYRNPKAYLDALQRNYARLGLMGMDLLHGNVLESWQERNALEAMVEFNELYELPNDNLNLVDRLHMAHGIEIRVPFLDEEIVRLANSLPIDYKLRNGKDKHVLREASKRIGLPREVSERPKLMAGRDSVPLVIRAIENYADSIVSDKYLHHHPLAELLDYEDLMLSLEDQRRPNDLRKLKSYVLAFDLLQRIFVGGMGTEPSSDLLREHEKEMQTYL